MSELLVIGILFLLYYGYKNGQIQIPDFSATAGVSSSGGQLSGYAFLGPNSDPSRWWNGIQPGTVTVSGQPGGSDWQPSHTAQTGFALAGAGIAGTEGVATAVGATAEGGAFAAGTALGTAIPLIGIGIAVVGTIVGMITAHHQQALAREGQALNGADQAAYKAFALVLQAVLNGEISDAGTAQQHVNQIVSDWANEVAPVQRGKWIFDGSDMSADYQKVWIKRTQQPGSQYHAPDPCNGACVVQHFFIQRGSFLVMAAVNDCLRGNHGVLDLPAIPAHETQSGVPDIKVVY